MNRRVVVTGLGAVTSIGIGWEAFWDGLLKGRSGIGPVMSIDTADHFTHNGGEISNFSSDDHLPSEMIQMHSRASRLALAAAKLSINDSSLSEKMIDSRKTGVCCGFTSGAVQTIEKINDCIINGKTLGHDLICALSPNSTISLIAQEFRLGGQGILFSTACAAGNYAIGYGYDLVCSGKADIILAGGSDAFSRLAFTGFNQFSAVAPDRCQPFDKNRKGMMVAEGAGILILESLESAMDRNAHIYAEILGYGLSCDAHHITTASVEGIAECMKKALRDAEISREDVDYISAHGTGTIANDKNECAAIREVFGPAYRDVAVSSIKSMLGHTMGAASALEAVTCSLVVMNDIIPPTINFETPDPECDIDCVPNVARRRAVNIALNNSYAFGGNNASVVFKKFI